MDAEKCHPAESIGVLCLWTNKITSDLASGAPSGYVMTPLTAYSKPMDGEVTCENNFPINGPDEA